MVRKFRSRVARGLGHLASAVHLSKNHQIAVSHTARRHAQVITLSRVKAVYVTLRGCVWSVRGARRSGNELFEIQYEKYQSLAVTSPGGNSLETVEVSNGDAGYVTTRGTP